MRKLIVFIHSTLNGIVTGDPSGDPTDFMVWTTPRSLETGSEHLMKTLETVDTVLLGRSTYQDLKRKWPFVADWPDVDDLTLKLGEKVNTATKLVVTNQSNEVLEWGAFTRPRRIAGNDLEGHIKRLKVSEGGDIITFGSPTLVRSLMAAGLIDEFQLQVHPVVINVGEPLFDRTTSRTDLHLVEAQALDDGSVLVRYGTRPRSSVDAQT